jgi:hypothetical protein
MGYENGISYPIYGILELILISHIILANQNSVFGSGFAHTNLEPMESRVENKHKMRIETSYILFYRFRIHEEVKRVNLEDLGGKDGRS